MTKKWKPKKREQYFHFIETLRIYSNVWVNWEIDYDRRKVGNCFRTKSLAQKALKKIKAILKGCEHG